MDDPKLTAISKFLSLVLRHQPGLIGLVPDAAGWAEVDDLLRRAAAHGRPISQQQLAEVVSTNDKKRFAFSDDGARIRASQGHSIEVDLGLPPRKPPAELFHGTAKRTLEAILRTGLEKRARHHVHLTERHDTALAVGRRYGAPALLRVDSARMAQDGFVFHRSENGVWLVDSVPATYLELLS